MDPEEVDRLAAHWRAGKLSDKEVASLINTVATMGMQFVPDIEAALDHSDPIVRINALHALWFAFTPERRLDRIIEIFNSDEDEDVRCGAAWTLSYLAADGTHSEISELLNNVIADPSQPQEVKISVTEAVQSFAASKARRT
jgi:HEAT repeat protein